jgi:peptidoglycan/LPS O-acetylase OafA/YrhL
MMAPILLFIIAVFVGKMLPGWMQTNAKAWRFGMSYVMASQYCIFMFIGVVFNYLYSGKIDHNKAYLSVGVIFCLFCIHWWIGPFAASIHVAWSYAFALIAFVFAYTYPSIFRSNRIFNFLADISSPLYVVNGVAGYFALRVLLEIGFGIWPSLIAVTTAALLISWALHKFVEIPTQIFGKKLSKIDFSKKELKEIKIKAVSVNVASNG